MLEAEGYKVHVTTSPHLVRYNERLRVAGQLIEEVTGQTWEVFMRDRVLRPGGMTHATSDSQDRFRIVNRSHPHARLSGPLRGLGRQTIVGVS